MVVYRRSARVCVVCHREYIPNSNRQSYCGQCRKCGTCGKVLKRQDKRRYCSSKCWGESLRYPPIPCGVCGKPVPRVRSRKAVYCSPGCRNASRVGRTHYDAAGYVKERTLDGWELQHRLVVGRAIGRPLRANEAVHHKNGIKQDNRLENLELCVVGDRAHPPGQRIEDLVTWAQGVLNEYAEAAEILRSRS